MSGNLERAVSKIKQTNGNEWGGYLTPSEILALLEAGADSTYSRRKRDIQECKQRLEAGQNNPWWWYFTIRTNSELSKRVPLAKPRHGRKN